VGVFADMPEIGTHEGERLVFRPPGDLLDPPDRLRIEDIAADAVAGVGRRHDDRSVVQLFHDLLDQPELRVFWIYFQKHMMSCRARKIPDGC